MIGLLPTLKFEEVPGPPGSLAVSWEPLAAGLRQLVPEATWRHLQDLVDQMTQEVCVPLLFEGLDLGPVFVRLFPRFEHLRWASLSVLGEQFLGRLEVLDGLLAKAARLLHAEAHSRAPAVLERKAAEHLPLVLESCARLNRGYFRAIQDRDRLAAMMADAEGLSSYMRHLTLVDQCLMPVYWFLEEPGLSRGSAANAATLSTWAFSYIGHALVLAKRLGILRARAAAIPTIRPAPEDRDLAEAGLDEWIAALERPDHAGA